MNRRSSLGLLVFLAVIALLTWYEAPQRSREGAVAVAPPAPASSAASTPAPETAAPETAASTAPSSEVASLNPPAATPAPQSEVMPGPTAGPSFDVVRVEPSGDAVLAGQAEPKAKVEVLDGNAPIASTASDDTGAWALTLDKPLAPGSHDLGLRSTAEDKTTATLSDERVTVSVPDKGSKDVLVVMNSPNAPSKILEVPAAPAASDAASAPASQTTVATAEPPAAEQSGAVASATAAPTTSAAEPPVATEAPVKTEPPVASEAPVTTAPPIAAEPPVAAEPKIATEQPPAPSPEVVVGAVEADTSGALYVGGTAKTGETVRVYLNDQPLGENKPSAAGTWLVQGKRDLPAGKYTVRADQVGADGKVVARSEVPFEREVEVAELKPNAAAGAGQAGATATGQVAMETVVIKRGDNLWRIARGAWGNGFRWTTIYQANNDQIRNPHWIYPGQVFIMPKGDATWTE